MKPQHTLGRALRQDGKELVLYERDGVFSIRVNGLELMSSRAHGSEEALARLVLAIRKPRPKSSSAVSMGYTLRAVLDAAPQEAGVLVAEIFPAVVEWNRADLAELARSPLLDPGVTVQVTDVADVFNGDPAAFDAILLDVDNGPDAYDRPKRHLYGSHGLKQIRRGLRPRGSSACGRPTRILHLNAGLPRRLDSGAGRDRAGLSEVQGPQTHNFHRHCRISRSASAKIRRHEDCCTNRLIIGAAIRLAAVFIGYQMYYSQTPARHADHDHAIAKIDAGGFLWVENATANVAISSASRARCSCCTGSTRRRPATRKKPGRSFCRHRG